MKEMKTLTLNGKTYDSFHDAEARERLDELEQNGAVKTVNGIAPDENGNVEIPVSGGDSEVSVDGETLVFSTSTATIENETLVL